MRITVLLFCLFVAAATIACSAEKQVSANAGSETASGSHQPPAALNDSARAEKAFGSDSGSALQNAALTGIYEYKGGNRSNEIRVLQISDGVLKVSFLGNSEFESQMGPMANSGVISARKIQLENGSKALLTSEDAPDCNIILTFKKNRLEVTQNENDCGFPNGVSAEGVYRKTSSKAPIFDFDEEPDDNAPDAILENQAGKALDDTVTRIRFNAGENSSIVKGQISGGEGVTYLIGARAGQTMSVKVIDGGTNSDVVFDVIAPDGARMSGGDRMHDNWSRKLPATGDYKIRVSAIESETTGYRLQIVIR